MTGWHAEFFAFRAPALPMSVLTAWADGLEAPSATAAELPAALERDGKLLRERLDQLVERPEVANALAIASPDLLDARRDRADDEAVVAALARYVTRMASRCTPFGLFAGCGTGSVGNRTRVELPPLAEWRRHTRLDGDYLDRLVRAKVSKHQPSVTFRPNDSLYAMGGRRRYVQTRQDGLVRTHHLAEIASTPHLDRALEAAARGAVPGQIASAVERGGVEAARAVAYVEGLIDAQVLVPTIAVPVTGPSAVGALIDDLDAIGDADGAQVLRDLRTELQAIDSAGPTMLAATPGAVASEAGARPASSQRAQLVQVDMTVPGDAVTLARSTVEHIARGVDVLRRMAPSPPPNDLERFRDTFDERFGGREVPLLEALDDDLGLGYGTARTPAPLLDGLRRTPGDSQYPIGQREHALVDLLHRAWTAGAHEVSLTADDIARLENPKALPLPDALGVMATLAQTTEGDRIVLTGASGPSGAGMLGRFCEADPELATRVRAHLRDEERLDPDAIHAEIVHLPSGVVSNIVARPVLREWEVEWLGRSGATSGSRLPASDLVVSVRRGRVVLRSASLGRHVVPRLTAAHNWSGRAPAVYRFLADLQHQGTTRGVGWSWGPFEGAPFTPRVVHGCLVLALARWTVPQRELRTLDHKEPAVRWYAVQGWRAQRRVPRWARVADGDNKLVIDFDNPLSVDVFVRLVRRRDEAVLEEVFPRPDELVAGGPDGARAMELVIPMLRPTTRTPEPAPVPAGRVRRTFPPGSEWTYLKLYSGCASADTLLRTRVRPLVAELIDSGVADRWFFIRYADPGHHLRIRFHGESSALVTRLQDFATAALDDRLVHEVQFGTYEREIERYGGPEAIDHAERLFHADSDAVVALLEMFEPGAPGLDERWRIGALGVDALLRDVGLDLDARAAKARHMHRAFEREFGGGAELRTSVAKTVRAEARSVETLLGETAVGSHPLAPGIAVVEERSRRLAPLLEQFARRSSAPMDVVVESFAHMWLDRLCRSENRFHEYVTYALLDRVLQAQLGRRAAQAHRP